MRAKVTNNLISMLRAIKFYIDTNSDIDYGIIIEIIIDMYYPDIFKLPSNRVLN